MTVRELYVIASAFIGDRENDDRDNRDLSIPYMNVLLQEALGTENTIRQRDGEMELEYAQIVTDLDDEITYHDSIVMAALPYGLAWQYHQEAGNLSLASQYRNMYIDALEENRCFNIRSMR
jgi:hypothetical protein